MVFHIDFLDSPVPREWLLPREKARLAQITIQDSTESVVIATDYWTEEDYVMQWTNALNHLIKAAGDAKDALITQIYDPKKTHKAYIVEYWTLYKYGEKVFIQQNYLQRSQLTDPSIDSKNFAKYIPDRQTHTKEGDEISEWTIDLDDLRLFLESLNDLQFDMGTRSRGT